MKPLILFLIVTLMNFHNFLSQHPDLTLHEYKKPKQSRLKNCSPKNSSVKTPWVEIQKEHTLLSFQKYIFLLLKWNKTSKTSSYWMFWHDSVRFFNPVGAFELNDVSFIEILIDSLHSWLRIGWHLPVRLLHPTIRHFCIK